MNRKYVERAAAELATLKLVRELRDVIAAHETVAIERRKTVQRETHHGRKRTEQELEILAFARSLEPLTRLFPRFESELRKLQHYARKQLTSPMARRREILALVSGDPIEIDEVFSTLPYDKPTIRADIKALVKSRKIIESLPESRGGSGRPVKRVLLLAGPSATSAQHG
jgi:hypothetical protein